MGLLIILVPCRADVKRFHPLIYGARKSCIGGRILLLSMCVVDYKRKGAQAMNASFKVTKKADISGAIAHLERAMGNLPAACALVCEELLGQMVASGYSEITVTAKGRHTRRVVICAPGERDDRVAPKADDEIGRIENEIKLNLLAEYADYVDYRYKGGVNRYTVYADGPRDPDLSGELYAFYENADDRAREKPLSVLVFLARNHRARFILSMLVKALKHLGALMLPVFAAKIIDVVVTGQPFFSWAVMGNVLGSLVALLVNLVCFWIDANVYHRFARAVESAFKMAIVRKLQTLSLKYHNNAHAGLLLSKLTDVQFIEQLIYERLTDVLHLCIDVVFVIVTAWVQFPPMLLFYVIIVPAAVLFIRRAAKPMMDSKAHMRRQTERTNAAFKEMLDMDTLTRAQGMQNAELQNISSKVRRVQDAANQYDRLGVWVNNITYGGSQGFKLLCLCFAAFLASMGYISVGTVVLFQSLFEMIINSVQRVLDELPQITQGYDSLVSVNEILLEKDIEHNGTQRLPEPVRGEIELKDVVFAYDEGEAPVLDGVSLRIPAGTSAAFIGKSGTGKTTLMNLILGLYSKQGGEILIDGVDVDALEKNSYRRHVAVVPQNTVLFSGTLWDNLVYGLKYVSTEQVLEALRSVGLEDLLRTLPDGLQTQIHENGGNLSGGQRQRVAIARALLRGAKIILFDEATSALDADSERQVQEAIDAVMRKCTVVMVAHRLNTLRKVDRIYRIEDGRATPCESYEEVIRRMDTDSDFDPQIQLGAHGQLFEIARRMKAEGIGTDVIARTVGLSEGEVNSLIG